MASQFRSSTGSESFEATVKYLKDRIQERGNTISDTEIAQKLNIPVSTFLEYLEKDSAPEEMLAALKREYKDVIGTTVIGNVELDDEFTEPDES